MRVDFSHTQLKLVSSVSMEEGMGAQQGEFRGVIKAHSNVFDVV